VAVQLTIPYETLVELVSQLPPQQQRTLIERLQAQTPKSARLSERLMIFDRGEWPETVTLRREDEYGDDGR
jgi:hypothetical protein